MKLEVEYGGNNGMSPKTLKIDKLPTIRRLPNYPQILRGLTTSKEEFVSSAYLAEKMNIEAILVRKDLELTGVSGTPRVGFRVQDLIQSIEAFLGWGGTVDACLVGTGQMGLALLANQDLSSYGVRIVAAFDNDKKKNRSNYLRCFGISPGKIYRVAEKARNPAGDSVRTRGKCTD